MKLGALDIRGLSQGDDTIVFFVHITRNTANSAAFTGCIAPIEQNDRFAISLFEMALHFDELSLTTARDQHGFQNCRFP
jgi:hypothetical protein